MSPRNRLDAPPAKSGLGRLSARAEGAGGDITDLAGPVGPRAASAVPPRLFLRRTSRSFGKRTNERETSARGAAIGRAGTLAVWASVMAPAPSRSDGTRTRERETSARGGGGFGRAATLAVWTSPAVSPRFGFRRS